MHIAIIPDGNRRWAKKHGKSLLEAYDIGIRKFLDVAKWAKEAGVETLTAWAFSTENFKRDKEELDILFMLFERFLKEGIKRMEKEKRKEFKEVKVNFLGRLHLLPPNVSSLMEKVMDITKDNKPYTVNFMVAYGGRAEIVDAVNKAINEGKKVDEETFSNYLYTAGQEDPDIIIRTGGEKRLSGFLPWQSVYTELFFIDKYWPDFSKEDFMKVMEEFKSRKRRFGR